MPSSIRTTIVFAAAALAFAACSSTASVGKYPDGSTSTADARTKVGDATPSALCLAFGQTCVSGGDCCSGLCDPASATCVASINKCTTTGGACASSTECCSLACSAGRCSASACLAALGRHLLLRRGGRHGLRRVQWLLQPPLRALRANGCAHLPAGQWLPGQRRSVPHKQRLLRRRGHRTARRRQCGLRDRRGQGPRHLPQSTQLQPAGQRVPLQELHLQRLVGAQ